MKPKQSLIAALSLFLAVSPLAFSREKKGGERGMLESMQSVPCGSKERGVTGLGSVFASVGVAHVNSHEQLCPQYLLRSDEMDYHIRPLDAKHAGVLPVGHEAEFKIKNNRLFLKVPGDDKKAQPYQIVAMQPASSGNNVEGSTSPPPEKPANAQPPTPVAASPNPGVAKVADPQTDHPPQQ